MITDVVFEPFGADADVLVNMARLLDDDGFGFGGLWVYDHFTAMVQGAGWSLDPFALLGAYAAVTERLRLGTLVANIYNRHTVQLASAIATVASIAGDRVVCGIGSGAAPGSRFAVEHDAIGTELRPADQRREDLIATIAELRQIWATNRLADATDIVDATAAPPPIVVGASGETTVAAAADHADGVNIRDGERIAHLVGTVRERARPGFEISVITGFQPDHPLGGDPGRLIELGVDRRVLAVSWPFDPEAVMRVGRGVAATLET